MESKSPDLLFLLTLSAYKKTIWVWVLGAGDPGRKVLRSGLPHCAGEVQSQVC